MEYQKKSDSKKDKKTVNSWSNSKSEHKNKFKKDDKSKIFKSYESAFPKKNHKSNMNEEKLIKDNNNSKMKEKVITDYFYMSPNLMTAKMIEDIIKSEKGIQVDLWEEMNILQIEFSNKLTVDFEPMNNEFKDSSDAAFIKNRNVKTIFAVTIDDGAFEILKPLLRLIITEFDGFLCADSVDFKPIYALTDL